MNGILLVNKPEGLTSNAVLQRVKRYLGIKKAGHTGSLDPIATGMLPLCLGEATKFSQYLLDADKSYQAVGRLGIKTDSADITGQVIACHDKFHITRQMLSEVLAQFTGPIQQIPNKYSALKYQGKALYHYARAGIDVPSKSRTVWIHELKLMDFDGRDFAIEVTCSKGTYIRNLIEDIGEKLGVYAHMTRLHRCYTAGFAQENMYSLEDLLTRPLTTIQPLLIPMDRAVSHLPAYALNEEEAIALFQGKMISLSADFASGSVVRLYQNDTKFLGVGEILPNNQLKGKRLVAYGVDASLSVI